MSEKASRKDDETDPIQRSVSELPEIPVVEELALSPLDGDEIDPAPKWWDDGGSVEKSRVENRRIEDGGETTALSTESIEPIETLVSEEAAPESSRSLSSLTEPVEGDFVETEKSPVDGEQGRAVETPAAETEALQAEVGSQDLSGLDSKPEEVDFSKLFPKGNEEQEIEEEMAKIAALPERAPFPIDLAAFAKEPLPTENEEALSLDAPSSDDGVSEEVEESPSGEKEETDSISQTVGSEEKEESLPEGEDRSEAERPSAETSSEVTETDETREEEPSDSSEAKPESQEVEEDSVPSEKAVEPSESEGSNDSESVSANAAEERASSPSSEEREEPLAVIGGGLTADSTLTASDSPKAKRGCWSVFTTLFFFATLATILLLVLAGGYAWKQVGSLEEKVTAMANAKLERRGIYLDYGAWQPSTLRGLGLLFDEVTVYGDADKTEPLIKIYGVGVNTDLVGMLQNLEQVSAAEFVLYDSKLALYEAGELVTELEGVRGEIVATSERITIEGLSTMLNGVLLDLNGVVNLGNVVASSGGSGSAGDGGKPEAKEATSPAAQSRFSLSALRELTPWLELENFGDSPPRLRLSFELDSHRPELAKLKGSFIGGPLQWRGIEISGINGACEVDLEEGAIHLPDLQVKHASGLVAADLTIRTEAKNLHIEEFYSTVDWKSILSVYDPNLVKSLEHLQWHDGPTLQISGVVPFEDPASASLKIRYDHPKGITYRDGERELPISDLRGNLTYLRGALETNNFAGNLFGGQVLVNGATNLLRENRPFTGLVEIIAMPLEKALPWFGKENVGLSGQLYLVFRGTGNAAIESINGGGSLRIDEANFPTFPIVSDVQSLVGGVIPAFSLKKKTKGMLRGAYIIESGVLVTNDLTVSNDGSRQVTNASVNLSTMETNFTTTASLEPLLATATGLEGKSIRIKGSGPLAKPKLEVEEFPIEFAAEGLNQVLGTSTESLEGLKSILGDRKAAEVITGTIEDATGFKIDPGVTEFLKGILGGEVETPMLRAIPEE